ncbi:MAG: hypothetical protein M3441_02080 [Chloroflexota bacterium]|nr:hypothetical protein [Chloroflexota bacterium]
MGFGRRIVPYVLVSIICLGLGNILRPLDYLESLAQGQENCQTFNETGKTVCGRFLQYWRDNGGLAQQGFPISSEFLEKSDLNGMSYRVQYFERAVFELHPENPPPHDVLLSQLGTFRFREKYPNGEPVAQGSPVAATSTPSTSAATATATPSRPYSAEEDARTHPTAPPPDNPRPQFNKNYPGAAQRTCVDVAKYDIARSGEFVAGNFQLFIQQWRPNLPERQGKIWWVPLHQDQMQQLTVKVIRHEDLATIVRVHSFSTIAENEQGSFYPSGIALPSAGRWRLVATSGPNWGCFDVAVGTN